MNHSKKDLRDFIMYKLGTDKAWADKALFALYNLQTPEEKLFKASGVINGVGFTNHDSRILSRLADSMNKKRIKDKSCQFEPSEFEKILFKKLPKYWNQILNISKKKSVKEGFDTMELINMTYTDYIESFGIQQALEMEIL